MGAYLPGRPACSCLLDGSFMACKGLLRSLRATLAARSPRGSSSTLLPYVIPLLPEELA